MRDQLVADIAVCTTHNKHKRRTSMSSTAFEPMIPSIQMPQTHALDGTATEIGILRRLHLQPLLSSLQHTRDKL
jgi:hypothetical protein